MGIVEAKEMTERMTDERLDELEYVAERQAFLDNACAFELLQALKAERKAYGELDRDATRRLRQRRKQVAALEAGYSA